MKKIICIIFAFSMIFSLASCSKTPEVEQNPVVLEQKEQIDAFGGTITNKRLVVFNHTNEYVKYIVADYYENGTKKKETVYLYYISEYCYKNALPEFKNMDIKSDDSLWLISYSDNNCDTGSFAGDYDKLEGEYYIK